jgi:transposase
VRDRVGPDLGFLTTNPVTKRRRSLWIDDPPGAAGPDPEVVIEAAYGWYWVVDLLQANGGRVHLANPRGLNWGQRRVKNDERDAIDLVDMLRLGWLPEAWIAPPATRELRELGRYRPSSLSCARGSRPRCTR